MLFWAVVTLVVVVVVVLLLLLALLVYGEPGRHGFSKTQKELLAEVEPLSVKVRAELSGWVDTDGLNLELTAWVYGQAEAATVEGMLTNDFACCREVRPEDVSGRSWRDRALTLLTRILTPVL
jgi:hypothetical protein